METLTLETLPKAFTHLANEVSEIKRLFKARQKKDVGRNSQRSRNQKKRESAKAERSPLDSDKLSSMIKSKRGKQGLRSAASEIGISAPTLSRIEQGNLPDIDTYVKICEWLKVPTDYFTGLKPLKKPREIITASLRADKTLPPETAEALINMINLAYSKEVCTFDQNRVKTG
jgi:transcriptional regulator with XRE-family HTH domain